MLALMSRSGLLGSGPERGERDSSIPQGATAPPPALPPTVGWVIFTTHRGEPALAILDRTGVWRCPELPVLDRVLNALFCPDMTCQETTGFGDRELDRVARWIRGTVGRPRRPG